MVYNYYFKPKEDKMPKTVELRYRLARLNYGRADADDILRVCKESGLKFAEKERVKGLRGYETRLNLEEIDV